MKPRMIREAPDTDRFLPTSSKGIPLTSGKEAIEMMPDEVEALRLVDYEGLIQEEAAEKMGVSRGTMWRCLDSARRKVAAMIVEGRELAIYPRELCLPEERTKRKSS